MASLTPFIFEDRLGTAMAHSMTFAILSFTTIWMAISLRHAYLPAWTGPFIPYWLWIAVPAALTVLGVVRPFLQNMLSTTGLTGAQWQVVFLVALAVPKAIETIKAFSVHEWRAILPDSQMRGNPVEKGAS